MNMSRLLKDLITRAPLIRGDIVKIPYGELQDLLIEAVSLLAGHDIPEAPTRAPRQPRRTHCAICGQELPYGTRRTVYCSPTCKTRGDYANKRRRQAACDG